jgi:mannose-6-phosphate isomerase
MDSQRIRLLRNPVRKYAWGSRTAIPELLGQPSPAPEPQAELWMGAHPSAPSRVVTEAGEIPLDEWIARDPQAVLGADVAARFGGKLPFLFKVLAAEQPLSIQAHPGLEQARAGFARENAAGISLDSPQRCYRDDNRKPELICALTPFHALCRFRVIGEIVAHFETLGARELVGGVSALREQPTPEGLARFFQTWMTLDPEVRKSVLARAGSVAAERGGDAPAWYWVSCLAQLYPNDVGVLAPLFLNVVTLDPGQAMYLPPGELHGYLGGVGVELMANSDNVLRGGLTTRHVDVEELLAILSFASGAVERLAPMQTAAGEEQYVAPVDEFALSVHRMVPGATHEISCDGHVEILLCTQGLVQLRGEFEHAVTSLERGASAFVPAGAQSYRIEGEGTLYRATAGARFDLRCDD